MSEQRLDQVPRSLTYQTILRRKFYFILIACACLLALVALAVARLRYPALPAVLLGIPVAIFMVAGIQAYAIKCPRCAKPYHHRPIGIFFMSKKCGRCGFPSKSDAPSAQA